MKYNLSRAYNEGFSYNGEIPIPYIKYKKDTESMALGLGVRWNARSRDTAKPEKNPYDNLLSVQQERRKPMSNYMALRKWGHKY